MDAFELQDDYESKIGLYTAFGPVTESIVREVLRGANLPVHAISSRAKAKPSAIKKGTREGAELAGIDGLHDLLGLRIITYFADQVDLVGKEIENHFSVDLVNSVDKRVLLDPDRFGYLSLHYVVSLNEARIELPEYVPYAGLKFEIQIRSILQHAWAEIEHDLGYKSPEAIPQPLRRRFSRLAGLLELADDEFKSIRNSAVEYAAEVTARVQSGGDAEINQESILAFVEGDARMIALDTAIATRYGAPLISISAQTAGVRAEELTRFGYKTLSDVRNAVEDLSEAITTVATEWLVRPESNTYRGPDGRYESLMGGIGLFYLYLYQVALRDGTYGSMEADGFFDVVQEDERLFLEICTRAKRAVDFDLQANLGARTTTLLAK